MILSIPNLQKPRRLIFHLLPNAHLDPVWLWDWREGLNESVTTVTTVLDLMDEEADLTFIRGEALIYRHIQKTAPKVFRRILRKIEEGRWDAVGGTYVQPDSNLASTEILCRHFEVSLRYFEKELSSRPTVGWQPDSFGHTAGWPNILNSFGLKSFAFTRPSRSVFPLRPPAFWWKGDHGNRLLCYRPHWHAYGSERGNMREILDVTLRAAEKGPLRHVGVLIGLGNHGGGPTRRHLADARDWAERHPEVRVQFSTLHRFFRDLASDVSALPARQTPSVSGEFGFCLRGCSSSVQKFKSRFRRTEAGLISAEITRGIMGAPLRASALEEAWKATLFNSFHDILPGSSIERAMEEQEEWMGGAAHAAHGVRFEALNRLAGRIDTRVPLPKEEDKPGPVPILLWNPLPRPFRGHVEIEAGLDYRPFFDYENRADDLPFAVRDLSGRTLPFQEIATEHTSIPAWPWRKRVLLPVALPPLGWKVVAMGWSEKKAPVFRPKSPCEASERPARISGSDWEIDVSSSGRLLIRRKGRNFFSARQGLQLMTVEDCWGSWGGMKEEPDSYCLDRVRHTWKMTEHQILERGPERAALWTRWRGGNSWLALTFHVERSIPWVVVLGRLLWNERSARLQMVLPSAGTALCDVPGSVASRKVRGQVPVGRWFLRKNGGGAVGVASDVLSDADFRPAETRLTLARASRYANDVPTGPREKIWQPAVDCGELKFRLCLFSDGVNPDHAADALLQPPVTLSVTPSSGPLPPAGSFGELFPATMKLLSLQRSEAQVLKLRIQNRAAISGKARFRYLGRTYFLGRVGPQQIVTRQLALR